MTGGATQLLKPVSAGERIRELDIVRGFALFGVLLVNIVMFNSTTYAEVTTNSVQQGFPDRLTAFIVQVFAVGNFYTIFSFLFGLGFYVFMERAEDKGLSAEQFFKRRALFLVLFGVLHYVLVWRGDVLHAYGVIGLLLLRFRSKSLKSLGKWIIVLLLLSTIALSGTYDP